MLIGKPLLYQNKSLKFQIVTKLLMLVNYLSILIVGQGAYGIVVAAKDK